jgi:hypothetical protein
MLVVGHRPEDSLEHGQLVPKGQVPTDPTRETDPERMEARRKRHSETAARRGAEAGAWDGEAGDPTDYEERILPGLRDVPLMRIVEATGLSLSYASLVRQGRRVPHPRWWSRLSQTVPESGLDNGIEDPQAPPRRAKK